MNPKTLEELYKTFGWDVKQIEEFEQTIKENFKKKQEN